eukprot:TRINITY_DN535_c0_g1_i1.p1 TRINITY_DN535_c0_g1~~TRINITY_DN535_c0_g1_i1.p1  ORF type:complete len:208 (-),score=52.55 TRINITY_DN535_c0_g1_i1:51-674(-)
MADKFDVSKGLKELDDYLKDESYIVGYQPSSADAEMLAKISSKPDDKFKHVQRWWKHISSFSVAERSHWGSAGGGETKSESEPAADEEELDLFGEQTEEEKAQVQASMDKAKQGQKKVIAKSNIIWDVKPLDDTTDLKLMEEKVRAITMEGLEWKASKLVDVAFGLQKLQIAANIIDDLVSTDTIEEKILENEDLIQSIDVVAFNKL